MRADGDNQIYPTINADVEANEGTGPLGSRLSLVSQCSRGRQGRTYL